MNMKTKRYIGLLLILMVIMGIGVYGISLVTEYYNNANIIGKWVSQKTGKTVEFTESGTVKVDNIKKGQYMITSPGVMDYTIEKYTFEMNYNIDKRTLVWGLSGEEEQFERKRF